MLRSRSRSSSRRSSRAFHRRRPTMPDRGVERGGRAPDGDVTDLEAGANRCADLLTSSDDSRHPPWVYAKIGGNSCCWSRQRLRRRDGRSGAHRRAAAGRGRVRGCFARGRPHLRRLLRLVKACSNLFAGRLSDRVGRKEISSPAGWRAAGAAHRHVRAALGMDRRSPICCSAINQGLCWSTTVIMKVDLVGPARRGLAIGLNEAAGYLAVSAAALASGYIAATWVAAGTVLSGHRLRAGRPDPVGFFVQ